MYRIIHCFSIAHAADLSTLTFDELMALREQCQLEIMKRPEWKEVKVPQGIWEIGVDIPEGNYTIILNDNNSGNIWLWGKAKGDYKSNGGLLVNTSLTSKQPQIGKLILKNGNILELKCDVIMSPVKGLGF